jgi:hypothetical protein
MEFAKNSMNLVLLNVHVNMTTVKNMDSKKNSMKMVKLKMDVTMYTMRKVSYNTPPSCFKDWRMRARKCLKNLITMVNL